MTHSYVTWLVWRESLWLDSCTCYVTHSYVTWLIHMRRDSFIRDMTHLYVTWLTHVWRNVLICDVSYTHVTWRIHIWHYSLIRAMTRSRTWALQNVVDYKEIIVICDMTLSYIWNDSFINDLTHACVTWVTHEPDRDRIQSVTKRTYSEVTLRIHKFDNTHS